MTDERSGEHPDDDILNILINRLLARKPAA